MLLRAVLVESLVTASFFSDSVTSLASLISFQPRPTLFRVAFSPEWDWEDACPEPILFLSWSCLHGDTQSHELPTMSGVCLYSLLEALTETRQGECSKAPSPRNHFQLCFRILTPSRSSPDWDLKVSKFGPLKAAAPRRKKGQTSRPHADSSIPVPGSQL